LPREEGARGRAHPQRRVGAVVPVWDEAAHGSGCDRRRAQGAAPSLHLDRSSRRAIWAFRTVGLGAPSRLRRSLAAESCCGAQETSGL